MLALSRNRRCRQLNGHATNARVRITKHGINQAESLTFSTEKHLKCTSRASLVGDDDGDDDGDVADSEVSEADEMRLHV